VRKLLGVGFPGDPAKVETLLGEMDVAEDPATVAAIVAEVRKTQLRFGAIPLGNEVNRLGVPADGVAEDRTVPPTLEEFKQQLPSRAPTSARTRRAGSPASATPPAWPSATGPAGCCWPATRRTPIRLLAGRASTSVSRTRSTWAGNWPPRSAAGAPEGLLDSYHTERRPVAADVLDYTRGGEPVTD
jgi:hypothetical protein